MNLKEKVLYILEEEPDTRNNDKLLTIRIWEHFYPSIVKKSKDGRSAILLDDMFSLPSQDNIKRARAIIQNDEGKFKATDMFVKIRRESSGKNKKTFGKIKENYGLF